MGPLFMRLCRVLALLCSDSTRPSGMQRQLNCASSRLRLLLTLGLGFRFSLRRLCPEPSTGTECSQGDLAGQDKIRDASGDLLGDRLTVGQETLNLFV